MDYSAILFKFRSCMEEIGDALREVSGTNDKYKFTEIASSIKTCAQVFYLGEGMSFDVSHIPGYQNLTADNFIVEYVGVNATTGTEVQRDWNSVNLGAHAYMTTNSSAITKTYNAAAGTLTIGNTSVYSHLTSESGTKGSVTATMNVKVYLVKGKIKNL